MSVLPFVPSGEPPIEKRLPPQNLEAEQGVLGGLLLDNQLIADVRGLLAPEDFYRDSHAIIYRSLLYLSELGHPVDAITLADELTRRDLFKKIGGDETLALLLDGVPHAANTLYHAKIVKEKAVARQVIDSANELLKNAYSNNFLAADLVGNATALASELTIKLTSDWARPGSNP